MRIKVRVTANAKESSVTNWTSDVLFVRLHAPPHEGKANNELIRLLAATFRIAKTEITILRGSSSKIKLLDLPIDQTALARLSV